MASSVILKSQNGVMSSFVPSANVAVTFSCVGLSCGEHGEVGRA